MSSSKKIDLKRDFVAGVYLEFIDWRYCQSCWYRIFDPAFCELLLHYPHSSSPPPRPVSKYRIYRHCVADWGWGGGGGGGAGGG